MMKNTTLPPEQQRKPETPDPNDKPAVSREAEEIYTTHMFWFTCAYCGPFLPMMDWNFVLNELRRLFHKKSARMKNKNSNDKTDETL
ncbi:hypothetical protein [Flavobacterium johnsoniae]|uniref:hypothetical protein n=1 Tax=Flavobacterium johnsoniae TaxID=986 RepID=UPI0032014527